MAVVGRARLLPSRHRHSARREPRPPGITQGHLETGPATNAPIDGAPSPDHPGLDNRPDGAGSYLPNSQASALPDGRHLRAWPDRGELGDQFGGEGRPRRGAMGQPARQIGGVDLGNLAAPRRTGAGAARRSLDRGANRDPPRRRATGQDQCQSGRAAEIRLAPASSSGESPRQARATCAAGPAWPGHPP